jgi:hypothetical protein
LRCSHPLSSSQTPTHDTPPHNTPTTPPHPTHAPENGVLGGKRRLRGYGGPGTKKTTPTPRQPTRPNGRAE